MLIFGHLGPSLAAARKIFGHSNTKAILFAGFLGLLPDIIDKPLAIFFFPEIGTSRIFGHTYFACLIYFMLLFLAFRNLRLAFLFALFPLGHLALDLIDTTNGWTNMFWPLVDFQPTFSTKYSFSSLISSIEGKFEKSPHTPIIEAFGLSYLLIFVRAQLKKTSQ